MLKRIHAPHLGRRITFGRREPVARGLRLRLGSYLRASLPVPPPSCDYSAAARSVLSDVYLNDELGDCVIAGGYHVVGVETGNAGRLFAATKAQLIADYSAIGGYVPGDPTTDQGCDEKTALEYWTQHGFANGTRLLGWLAIDPGNKTEVQAALYLFENVYFGIGLPDAWIEPFPPDGFTWGTAGPTDPQNGHCFVGYGYDAHGVKIDTWGLSGTITYDAMAAYASKTELYVLLSPDQLTKGQTRAPNGIDWTSLIADFDAMGGHVPIPAPLPPPAPAPPAPTPHAVTLAQAQAWAVQDVDRGHSVLTKGQADSLIRTALARNWPKN